MSALPSQWFLILPVNVQTLCIVFLCIELFVRFCVLTYFIYVMGRLAHCLLLREQTWSQIHKMQNQEKTVETPDIDDLYDIEI